MQHTVTLSASQLNDVVQALRSDAHTFARVKDTVMATRERALADYLDDILIENNGGV